MTFEQFLFFAIGLYVLQVSYWIWSLRHIPAVKSTTHNNKFVSVIVAARNEEAFLPACLESLVRQTYSASNYEVILVNDHSTDHTETIGREWDSQYSQFHLLNAIHDPQLKGKTNALAQGIDAARGDIIMITDADCIVPSTWIESTVAYFDDNIGLVGGITLQEHSSAFTGIQSLDWAFILGIAAATAQRGNPLGSIGNNLSFRKKAYEEVGGYRTLPFSVTEDYTLVQAIIGTGSWSYRYPIDPEVMVVSKACPDWKTLVRQKHRWGKGGLDMKPSGLLVMVIGSLAHLSPFIMLYWGGVVASLTALFIKTIVDYFFLFNVLKPLRRTDDLKFLYWFELYFILYTIALPFLVFFGGKVIWKERSF